MYIFLIITLAASLVLAQLSTGRLEKCSEGQWRCRDGACIATSATCNGTPDCVDGSDETFPLCMNTECKSGSFKCAYGACVKSTATCNGVKDCADNSDELLLRCRNETDYYECLTQEIMDNGDSVNGLASTISKTRFYRHISELCVMKDRTCKNGQIVGFPNRCDGKVDCKDGSDETVETCASNWCSMSMTQSDLFFRCAYGACVPKNALCNGVIDCADGSDENVEICNANKDTSGACILPHFPKHGYYVVLGRSSFYPGQSFDIIHLNFTCHPGYHLVGTRSSYCVNGWWSENRMPQCIDCGRINPGGKLLSIGGRDAKRYELPWHAGIYKKTKHPYQQVCGGSLISNGIIISAAHCFWNDFKKQLPASQFAVAVGKIYRHWGNKKDFDAQKSDVIDIRIPPRYQGENMNHQDDIALVTVATPFEYRAYVRPVCVDFDYSFNEKQLREGNLGKVAGWGLTEENGNASQVLKVVDLPYVHVEHCIDLSPVDYRKYITSDKICAGYTNGSAAVCKGDSGGGLTFPDSDNGIVRYFLRGIVSTAPNNDNLCNAYTVTSFTDVIKHESFIKEHHETPIPLQLTSENLELCSDNQWRCRYGRCIGLDRKCNGIVDCADASDETFPLCRNIECAEDMFQCTYGACVNSTATCNGVMDCADNSDELIPRCRNETDYLGCVDKVLKKNASHAPLEGIQECEQKERVCKNGEEIGLLKHCDGKVDCKDGSDETLETCASNWCLVHGAFRCEYGGCISGNLPCDGNYDCVDGSDESDELCKADKSSSGACVLPPFPTDGSYTVTGQTNVYPGKAYDIVYLNFTCSPGYRLVGPVAPSCMNGWWSDIRMPQCVSMCKLDKQPNIEYRCLTTDSSSDTSLTECEDYVLSGTTVNPQCIRNSYVYPKAIPLMHCVDGSWDHVAVCLASPVVIGDLRNCDVPIDRLNKLVQRIMERAMLGVSLRDKIRRRTGIADIAQKISIQVCHLYKNPSVEYRCPINSNTTDVGSKECDDYVPSGTTIRPQCRRTNLENPVLLPHMHCEDGGWDNEAVCLAECGRVLESRALRAIGGIAVRPGELPWQAGIYTKTQTPYTQICGGSLVTNTIVISAAHCFWGTTQRQPASNYAVAVGKIYRPFNYSGDLEAQRSDVKNIITPSRFQGGNAKYQEDIALVVVTTPFKFTAFVRPVCVDFDYGMEKKHLSVGKTGKVAGWGLTSEDGNKPSVVLNAVKLQYISIETCLSEAPESFKDYITSDKICAKANNGTALCRGDSGGGIVFPELEHGIDRYFLRGVVSTAPSNDKRCNVETFTAFTQISKHQTFIRDNFEAK